MAIKSADQITIIDVTDAYSVMLTSEAYTFIGSTSGVAAGASCTTEAVAFCGTNQSSAVNVTAADIVCPTGISATVENSGKLLPRAFLAEVSPETPAHLHKCLHKILHKLRQLIPARLTSLIRFLQRPKDGWERL